MGEFYGGLLGMVVSKRNQHLTVPTDHFTAGYSQSKAQYNTEKSGLQQQLSGLQSAEKQDYSQYQNDLANWTEGLQYKKNEYDNAYSAKQNGWQNFMNGALQVAGIAAKILPLFFI